MKDTDLSLAFFHGSTTQHSSLNTAVKVTTWGFATKKKPPSAVCAPLCHADFILALHAKFRVSINLIRFVLCDPIRDPIQVFSTLSNMSLIHKASINKTLSALFDILIGCPVNDILSRSS